eukprot:CAMPEP_0194176860 /NCGR_PEP_ID=MMETSP0154-20130528/10722_1 /TAXON_ID=1049557 /ORGANISM="Thalassiothrix antarctica, Strain L6-D1" /LENGTH=651 /DNA_ID=CAMNT_0038891213 /DNA_START=71 /DNA_END=2023 /DNA_ORIENTATION=-
MSNEGTVHPMIPVPEAIRIVIRETAKILLEQGGHDTKIISSDAPWSDILNSVLDRDVIMSKPGYPPHNASIMDGYCIRSEEFDVSSVTDDDFTHQVIDKIYAGDNEPLKKESASESNLPIAYYITTGAVIPDSFDCVVPIELAKVSSDGKHIQIQKTATIQKNKWIRLVGCDISEGSVVLPKGHRIDPIGLGLLKQSGAESIYVKRPIVVGVLSTGNELILGSKENASQPGKIPDVNRPILLSMLSLFGLCETVDLGMERDDDVNAMARSIDAALEKCDVIITTGGISMGESDILERVLVGQCGGTLHFGRMHMKPGKPTTFVTIPKGDSVRLIFAMPGNPVSGIVCTQLLVKPCLNVLFNGIDESVAALQSDVESRLYDIVENAIIHPEIEGTLSHDIKLDTVRPEYHRVTIETLSDGTHEVSTTGVQRSSRLISLRDSMGLLVLPVGNPSKPNALKGDKYPVLITGGFGTIKEVRLMDSMHLASKREKKAFKIAVVEVIPKERALPSALDFLCEQVQSAMSGSNSGSNVIVSKKTFQGNLDDLYSFSVDSNDADLIVVSCISFKGAFQYHLDVSLTLRNRLEKIADALALRARQGAAAQDPTSVLFESLVGYAPDEQGAILVCLSDKGLKGGLGNICGQIKYALIVARR